MADFAYCSLADLRAYIAPANDTTAHDAQFRDHIESASEQIDAFTGRTFRVYLATRYCRARYPDRLDLDADLLAVTSLKTLTDNSGGVRTYGDIWATTDYDLSPDEAPYNRQPYTRITANPGGSYWFPSAPRGVQIVGRWGYWQDTQALSATVAEALDSSETGVDVSSATGLSALQTILVDSEQLYITSISGNTLAVVRGVNGTTAAAHDSGAAIARYRYPEQVRQACALHAARMFNRSKSSPLGVSGSSDLGIVIRPTRMDSDVLGLLERFRVGPV